MDFGLVLVLLAVAGTVWALVRGIETMAVAHEVGHLDSEKWMVSRVALQAAAIVLILVVTLVQRLP